MERRAINKSTVKPLPSRLVTILHFDDTYFFQPHLLRLGREIDLRDLKGTRFMCAWDTMTEIERRLGQGWDYVTFLGRGDYHYATYIFLKRIPFPFALLLIDHHLDMKATFSGYISCGSWLREALQLTFLQYVIFVGSASQREEITDKILFANLKSEEILRLAGDFPLYISIDKDFFSPRYVTTSWDQGDATPDELFHLLSSLPRSTIVGMDICGEPDGSSLYEHARSENINIDLLRLFFPLSSPLDEGKKLADVT